MAILQDKSAIRDRLVALAAFIALIWAIQILNWVTRYSLNTILALFPATLAASMVFSGCHSFMVAFLI